MKLVNKSIKTYLKTFILSLFLLGINLTPKIQSASFEFEPSTTTFSSCQQQIDLIIDATGESSNSADIEIHWDHDNVHIIDKDPSQPQVQISTQNAYTTYWGNQTIPELKQILLAGGSIPDNNVLLTTREKFATIEFYFDGQAPATVNFSIIFDGLANTIDSNIASSIDGNDLLSWVMNGQYTFDTGENCIGYRPQKTTTFTSGSLADTTIYISTYPTPYQKETPIPQNFVTTRASESAQTQDLLEHVSLNEDIYKKFRYPIFASYIQPQWCILFCVVSLFSGIGMFVLLYFRRKKHGIVRKSNKES